MIDARRRVRSENWLNSDFGSSFLSELCHTYGKSEKETRRIIVDAMTANGINYGGLIDMINNGLLGDPQ